MDAQETARRLRAARAYAGLSRSDLGRELNVSKDTLERIENGKRELGDFEAMGFLTKTAKACGLPQAFFWVDFGELAKLPERDAELSLTPTEEAYLKAVREAIAGGVEAVKEELHREIRERMEKAKPAKEPVKNQPVEGDPLEGEPPLTEDGQPTETDQPETGNRQAG